MKNFFVLWTGQALSLIGSQAVQFALIWWLTARTGSATVLATATLVALMPQVVLGPLIGTLVDRWNRKRVMFVADAVVALASVVRRKIRTERRKPNAGLSGRRPICI